eukprot:SAG31_NODE_2667_length_5273_cov_2.316776_2_plen_312_part_00
MNREVTAAELAQKMATERGLTLLHPFEDPDVIAGQGSCGVEIVEQCLEKGIPAVDAVLICTGGGGLAAGCCLALADRMPTAHLYAVEPEGYDDHALSLASGERVSLEGNPASTMDSLQAVAPGINTFPINRRLLSGAIAVSDDEVAAALHIAFETLQIVLEPGGAAALAAVIAGKVPGGVVGRTIVLTASGGNTDLPKFAKLLGLRGSSNASMPFDWTGVEINRIAASGGLKKPVLMLKTHGGYIGCGLFNMETANALGEAAAVVRGVDIPEDMLVNKVTTVSEKAASMGVEVGMLGRDALEVFRGLEAKL